MTARAAAGRYARALLDVAVKESDPRAVERDLAAFVDLMREHEALGKALVNPAVPVQRKVAVIEQITARAGLSAIVSRLLGLLASRDRLELLAGLLEEYRRRVLDHERVVRAEVTAAVPLDDRQMAALGQAFARVTGRQVQVTAEVDAAVVGGVVVRIGSTVYDGSVRRHLERLRETLAGGI